MGDYWSDRDPGDERDTADPRYCPPHVPRVWSGRVAIADERVWAQMRQIIRHGDQLEAEAATLRAHLLALGLAARDYLACYPEGRQHGRDGKRLAEALVAELEAAGL